MGVFTTLFTSCISLRDKPISEGIIEYAINYPDSLTKPLKYDPSLRPERMVVKFKNNKTLSIVQGLSGAISFTFIQNTEMHESITLIKLFNKKLYFKEVLDDSLLALIYRQMPAVVIEPTQETQYLLDFKCQMAKGTFVNDSLRPFIILHTSAIAIDKPNDKTPYEPLAGVLLRFRVRLWGQTMQMEAINIQPKRIDDSDFLIPSGYEAITKETFDDILALVQ